jgi:SAM-dependent methyltransferase
MRSTAWIPVAARPSLRRIRTALRKLRRRFGLGGVSFGDLDRASPISRLFGTDRGLSVDRWYIERFLRLHAADIRGRVLEVAGSAYTERFGGAAVTRADVLHVEAGHSATIVGDLATGDGIPEAAFDAIVLTQTLQFVFDVGGAISTLRRALAPGGVLLATAPGISQISRYDADRWGDWWRFTRASLERLLAEQFGAENVQVEAHGNVKAAVAFLHGLACEDIRASDLEAVDADYELVLTARAVRA